MSNKVTSSQGECIVVFSPSTRTRTLTIRPTKEGSLTLSNWLTAGKPVSLRIELPPGAMELAPLWISLSRESPSVWRRALDALGIRSKRKPRRELSTYSDI